MTSVKPQQSSTFVSNFQLKQQPVQLIREQHNSPPVSIALRDLEAMRTGRDVLTASKHGLEAICGASCDTAAN